VVGAAIGEKLVSKEKSELQMSMLKRIVLSWVITIPLAMIVTVYFFYSLKGGIA